MSLKRRLHLYRVYDGQLSTISYGIRALKDMPGRKSLIMLTEETKIFKSPKSDIYMTSAQLLRDDAGVDFTPLYSGRFDRLTDDALRAGVVVNFLNIKGLVYSGSTNADISFSRDGGGQCRHKCQQLSQALVVQRR